jgi:putative phosphoesterase
VARALIISDSHGLTSEVEQVCSMYSHDVIFHCGDFCVDESKSPFNQMILVKGNNDYFSKVPIERKVNWEGLHIGITHGHTYHVNQSLMGLKYKALEDKIDVVLFGHTHLPVCIHEEGVIFMNPGSMKQARGFKVPTYALLDVEKQGEKSVLSFTYFDMEHHRVDSLSKRFAI